MTAQEVDTVIRLATGLKSAFPEISIPAQTPGNKFELRISSRPEIEIGLEVFEVEPGFNDFRISVALSSDILRDSDPDSILFFATQENMSRRGCGIRSGYKNNSLLITYGFFGGMARDLPDIRQGVYGLDTCIKLSDELSQRIHDFRNAEAKFDMAAYRDSLRGKKIHDLKIPNHRSECSPEEADRIFAVANLYLKETLGMTAQEIDSSTFRVIEPKTNTEIILSLAKTKTMITAWAFLVEMEHYFDSATLAQDLNRRLLIGHAEALPSGVAISTYRFLTPGTTESELKSILDGVFDAKYKLSELLKET